MGKGRIVMPSFFFLNGNSTIANRYIYHSTSQMVHHCGGGGGGGLSEQQTAPGPRSGPHITECSVGMKEPGIMRKWGSPKMGIPGPRTRKEEVQCS